MPFIVGKESAECVFPVTPSHFSALETVLGVAALVSFVPDSNPSGRRFHDVVGCKSPVGWNVYQHNAGTLPAVRLN